MSDPIKHELEVLADLADHDLDTSSVPAFTHVASRARRRARRRAATGAVCLAGLATAAVAVGPTLLSPKPAAVAATTAPTADATFAVPTSGRFPLRAIGELPAWVPNGTGILDISGAGCVTVTLTGSGSDTGTVYSGVFTTNTTAAEDDAGYLLTTPTVPRFHGTDEETITFRDGQQVNFNGAPGTPVDSQTFEPLPDPIDNPCREPQGELPNLFVAAMTPAS